MSFALQENFVFPIEVVDVHMLHPALASAVQKAVSDAVAQDQPFLIVVAGVPGAGKSSLLQPLAQRLAAFRPQIVAFDRLMKQIPEYNAEPDREAAFCAYELSARNAGYALVKALMEKRANFIFEHSSALASHVELVSYARSIGYRVCMVRMKAPLSVAKHRVDERQEREGRHTPASYVDERARVLDTLVGRYRAIVHDFIEIENTERDVDGRTAFFAEQAERIARSLSVA